MRGEGWVRLLRRAVSVLVLFLVLVIPAHPGGLTASALLVSPLELPVIVLALAAVGRGALSLPLRVAVVAALAAVMILRIADIAMLTALGRGFNPVSDLFLVEAGYRLLSAAIGPLAAIAALAAALALAVLIVAVLWCATGILSRIGLGPRPRLAAGSAALLFAVIAVADAGRALGAWTLPVEIPGSAPSTAAAASKVRLARSTAAGLREFERAARADPFAGRQGLLDAIDRDVLVVFVESYGRASLDTPLYAPTHRATLRRAESRLRERGLAMRSAYLDAPTRGGQSWLSHASVASGLRIDDQARYGAMLASGREGLFHIAARSGFETAAVMPAITLDWPEAAGMGFDRILAAKDLGYRGKPFNWVTMPDQFTLAALDRLVLSGVRSRPVFAQVALISSHAPWVPVPELLDWDGLGDGTVFDAMATAGDPPEVVWRDPDRVREQYRLAIDYTLRTVFDYAARNAGDPPLLIVLGDHQAAQFVALDERSDVPIHLIGPRHLLERTDPWGWSEGLVPSDHAPVWPMERMRDAIIETFTASPPVERHGS